MISDNRRLRILQVRSDDGELSLAAGAQVWQDDKGSIQGDGLWFDLLVPAPADLEAQARALNISTLEWLRQKLSVLTYIQIELM